MEDADLPGSLPRGRDHPPSAIGVSIEMREAWMSLRSDQIT
jgi:hypothetical protein